MSVYRLIHEVNIAGYNFKKIVSVDITKAIESFTNTARVIVPATLRYNKKAVFTDTEALLFKKGDKITIKLGYIKGIQRFFDSVQFEGFVSNYKINDSTVEIECEDSMYWLKRARLNFSAKSITLSDLSNKIITAVNNILPEEVQKIRANEANRVNLTLYNFKSENATALDILKLLKDNYMLDSFFTDSNTLNIGLNFNTISNQSNITFSQYPERVLKAVSNDKFFKLIDTSGLTFVKKEDVKFNITAKIFKKNGEVIEKKAGDPEGEQRTFILYGEHSDKEVEEFITNQLNRIKYSGFAKGSSFVTFGKPDIDLLSIVTFDGLGLIKWYNNNSIDTSQKRVYVKSSYLVDSINIRYNQSEGFVQTIGLSIRVNTNDTGSVAAKIEGSNKLLQF